MLLMCKNTHMYMIHISKIILSDIFDSGLKINALTVKH
jgi:hypothetical protein